MTSRHSKPLALALAVVLSGSIAPRALADETTDRAREEFVRGAELVKQSQWAEALAAFERSAKLRPHPVTTFDIGYCQRALGQYTRARQSFRAALADGEKNGELSESLVQETRGYLDEIERVLVHANVTLEPKEASVTVDGRPLVPDAQSPEILVAGVAPPGPGSPPPRAKFELLLDPGAHVVTIRRKGFADALVNRSFSAGQRVALDLTLDRLPATLVIASNEPRATVSIEGMDVGLTPLSLSRPAGSYKVLVRKPDRVPYEAQVVLQPGESTTLRANLARPSPSIFERWWFWTGAAVVVGGAVVGTYFATKPEPERPPVNGGGLGWAVEVP